MSKIGPSKRTVLMMELQQALKDNNSQQITQTQAEILSSKDHTTIYEMNKLLSSEQQAQNNIKDRILNLSGTITQKEEYDIAKGLMEVYSRLPKYFQDASILKVVQMKVESYKQRIIVDKQIRQKEKKDKRKPFWQKAITKVMVKLGYGNNTESFSHKKIEDAGTVINQKHNVQTIFSSDQQS